jgi:hypothetical protein
LALVQPLDAQFGGLGRRIGDAAKKAAGVESEESAKPADAATPGAPTPVALPTDDPSVIPITDKVLDGFARSLQTELDLRAQLFKELDGREAAVKKREACMGQVAGSPEYTAIMLRLGDLPENTTTEQMMKAMAQMTQDQEALLNKMCGPAPAPINTSQRLEEIKLKAAAAAGPVR